MAQRNIRDYEVSLWSLQDSFIAILKQYGLEYKGQIEQGKLQERDDGTQTFSFTIPMYYYKNGERIENPGWYSVSNGALLVNMRKVKVIFNKDDNNKNNRKIYEFLIVKVKEKHQNGELYCDVECQGLAFHQLGKIGYKISLTSDDFYNDDYEWSTTGKWYDGYGVQHTEQPLATLNYWNAKVFSTIDSWKPEIHMNWDSYSLYQYAQRGVEEDYIISNDMVSGTRQRQSDKVYEDNFIDSWKKDNNSLAPAHITKAKEKARINVDINESNIYNITQTLAEIFGIFCKYVYQHDDNFHIIARKVIYYNSFIDQKRNAIDINYKYQTSSISREIDSTDLVTKLYVKSIENNDDSNGMINIINVDANKSQQDYILNFDYLYQIGGITKEQYDSIDQYVNAIRNINEQITPLSEQIILLESKLNKLEAELTVRTNAISKDTEELFSNKELLSSLTQNTDVLSVTKNNPQTAMMLKDISKQYESYFIKITQKGIYPESIKLYKSYNYSNAQLSDEITTGQVEFDEFGNVIKISNLYATEEDSKVLYLIYDYCPVLYYERIEAIWEARLAQDNLRKAEIQNQLAKIGYYLYGNKSKYSMNNVIVNDINNYNIYKRYQSLIQQKEKIIKEFNTLMGAAIRQGYWQPEDYSDYGNKYLENLRIGEFYVGEEHAYTSTSGNSSFMWDNELFEDEQKLFYQYSVEQTKYAYPCINLEKHPEILSLIQNNLDKNVCFYYNPRTSIQDTPYARSRPAIKSAPSTIYVVKDLYNSDNTTVTGKITPVYDEELYSKYLGKLCQQWTDETYKIGYTTFKWQGYSPEEQEWIDITTYTQHTDKAYGDPLRYTVSVVNKYKNYVKFTNNADYPQQIQLIDRVNNNFSGWDGWKFRLIVKNNKGFNLDENNDWYNGSYNVTPTVIKRLQNHAKYTPSKKYESQPILTTINEFDSATTIMFSIMKNCYTDETMQYSLQYVRKINDNNLNFNTWVNKTDIINEDEWITIQQDDQYIHLVSTSNNSMSVTFKINFKNDINLIENQDEWRFRLLFRNMDDCVKNTYHYSESNSRIYATGTAPVFSYVDDQLAHINIDNTYSYEAKVYFDIPPGHFTSNSFIVDDNKYNVDNNNIIWHKISPLNQDTEISQNLGTHLTITKTLNIDTSVNKHYVTLKIDGNASYINQLIALDGYYIYPIIKNNNNQLMVVPDNYQKQIMLDSYKIITITTQLDNSLVYNVLQKTNTIFNDSYTILCEGTNITNYQWHIELSSGDIIINDNNTHTINNNSYKASMSTKDNKQTITLTLTIPRVDGMQSLQQAIINDKAEIYCIVSNDTDIYHYGEMRESYKETTHCRVHMVKLLSVNRLQDGENLFLNWLPKRELNTNKVLPYSIPLQISVPNLFKQSSDEIVNNISVNIQATNYIDVENQENGYIPQYNSSIYQTLDNYNENQLCKVKINIENTSIAMNDTGNQYIIDKNITLTPPQQFSDWTTVIRTSDSINDEKYAYFYKVTVIYSKDWFNEQFIFYIRVTILQRAPQFKNNTWKPVNNGATEFVNGLTLQARSGRSQANDIAGQVLNAIVQEGYSVVLPQNTKIYASNFGFDDDTVEYYQWRLNKWLGGHTTLTTTGTGHDDDLRNSQSQVRTWVNNNFPSVKLLPDTSFTLNDPEAALSIDRVNCQVIDRRVEDPGVLWEYECNSFPNGLIDVGFTTQYGPAIVSAGYIQNLYLKATNMWGTVRTKTFNIKFTGISSSRNLLYDPTLRRYKLIDEPYER